MDVSEAEDRSAFKTVALFCALRRRGDDPDDIAKMLKFDDADEMYRQLRDWDLPDWIIGQTSPTNGTEHRDRTKRHSRPQNLGPSSGLPPPSNATALFRERLEALLESLELLEHMDEDLRGKYFVRTDVDTTPEYIPRERASEEEWEKIRKKYNLDPDVTGYLVTDARNKMPGGVAKSPSEALSTLIGIYALAGGRMDLLVDALQRDPPPAESEIWNEIRVWVEGAKADGDKRDGLKVLARNLATWVRGSEVRSGRPPELSKADHAFACTITRYRKEGLIDEEIALKGSHRKKEDGTGYSVKEVTQLGDLGLSWS